MITEVQLQTILVIALLVEGIIEMLKNRLPARITGTKRTGAIRTIGNALGVALVAGADLSMGLFATTVADIDEVALQSIARVILWLGFGVGAGYGSHGVHVVRDAAEAVLKRMRPPVVQAEAQPAPPAAG